MKQTWHKHVLCAVSVFVTSAGITPQTLSLKLHLHCISNNEYPRDSTHVVICELPISVRIHLRLHGINLIKHILCTVIAYVFGKGLTVSLGHQLKSFVIDNRKQVQQQQQQISTVSL
jgi:hypothetical protein